MEYLTNLKFHEIYKGNNIIGYQVSCADCDEVKIVIPPTYKDLPVLKIKDYGFEQTNIEEVVLPDTVEEIGEGAFYKCSKLINIDLPSTLKVIGRYAFSKCENLKLTTLPYGIKKIKNIFEGCSQIYEFVIPGSVEVIKDLAFWKSGLEYIEIPSSVKTIEPMAFSECPENIKIMCEKKHVEQIKELDIFEGEDGIYPIMDRLVYNVYYVRIPDIEKNIDFKPTNCFNEGALEGNYKGNTIIKTKDGKYYKQDGFASNKYSGYEDD